MYKGVVHLDGIEDIQQIIAAFVEIVEQAGGEMFSVFDEFKDDEKARYAEQG